MRFSRGRPGCAVEDAGDGLHAQRTALDLGYVVELDGYHAARQLTRWLAEGRDSSATWDALFPHNPSNDGDNEITGIHVSDGDPTSGGILGAKVPRPITGDWRAFWTQQHGDNRDLGTDVGEHARRPLIS